MATTQTPRPRAGSSDHRSSGPPPDLTAITVVHRAMRRDAGRLARAVAGLDPGDAARARALRRWYGHFRAELTGHHHVEDELWFPLLAERVPTYGQHADRLARDHRLLEEAIVGVQAALDDLVSEGASARACGPARHATGALSDLLEAHLGFEDADIMPLYLRHFTEDEFVALERRTRRVIEARRLPFAVPWMLGAATPPERARMLDQAPLVVRLVWYASRRRQARLSARALGPAGAPTAHLDREVA